MKFLHNTNLVQFEWHIATFVEFYITHRYNLFILNFKIAPKVTLIFQIKAKSCHFFVKRCTFVLFLFLGEELPIADGHILLVLPWVESLLDADGLEVRLP